MRVGVGPFRCTRCFVEKPLTDFYEQHRKKEGDWCKACRRAYYATPEWRARFITLQRKARAEKRALITARKVAAGCADCGEKHPACLDLHHRDPSLKIKEVVKMIDQNASLKRIEAEADKCEVLCSNCHRKRHYNEREAAKVASA